MRAYDAASSRLGALAGRLCNPLKLFARLTSINPVRAFLDIDRIKCQPVAQLTLAAGAPSRCGRVGPRRHPVIEVHMRTRTSTRPTVPRCNKAMIAIGFGLKLKEAALGGLSTEAEL